FNRILASAPWLAPRRSCFAKKELLTCATDILGRNQRAVLGLQARRTPPRLFLEGRGSSLRSMWSVAEREGFEPPIPFQVCPLSRRIVSTTHAPLRAVKKSWLQNYFIRCHDGSRRGGG